MGTKKGLLLVVVGMCLLLSCCRQALSLSSEAAVLKRSITINGATHSYYVYLPPNFTTERRWPVMLYMHGRGSVGNIWRIADDFGYILRRHPERFPFVIVFPRCPLTRYWIGSMVTFAVSALDETVKDFNGDPSRLYVGGVSMGGYGTWIAAMNYPGKFAALAPVCGGIIPPSRFVRTVLPQLQGACREVVSSEDPYTQLAAHVGKTPAWLFHGANDRIVPVAESRKIAAALRAIGDTIRYTEFRNRGHIIGFQAFSNSELPRWLLEQSIDSQDTSAHDSAAGPSMHNRPPSLARSGCCAPF